MNIRQNMTANHLGDTLKGCNSSTVLLFKSIEEDNTRNLELALRMPNIDINSQNYHGETPLYVSLKLNRRDSFVMRLLGADCDVNIPTEEKVTPLHLAVSRPTLDIASELLKRGADVNIQEQRKRFYGVTMDWEFTNKTPLQCAVQVNSLNAVCLLLYYGSNGHKMTAVKYALHNKLVEIAAVLLNFYVFPVVTDSFCSLRPEGIDLLIHCFKFYQDATSFKLVWHRINGPVDNVGLNYLLITYIRESRFASEDWLECIFLILGLYVTHGPSCPAEFSKNFFIELFDAFSSKNIQSEDRVRIMSTCLSLGVPVTPGDFEYCHRLYGFGNELEMFIYAIAIYRVEYCAINRFEDFVGLYTITAFVLPVAADLHRDLFCKLLVDQFRFQHDCRRPNLQVSMVYFLELLEFYSLSISAKERIQMLCRSFTINSQKLILAKLDRLPNCPTLFELCRDQIRDSIRRSVRYPYQFHDHVKKLNCPEVIHDVIRLKRPIYF